MRVESAAEAGAGKRTREGERSINGYPASAPERGTSAEREGTALRVGEGLALDGALRVGAL